MYVSGKEEVESVQQQDSDDRGREAVFICVTRNSLGSTDEQLGLDL